MNRDLNKRKQEMREAIWRKMEVDHIAAFPLPARGRIPNFKGSNEAASQLRTLREYQTAHAIFVNPDAAQRSVRKLALLDSKKVVMATPKLKEGFIIVEPVSVRGKEVEAASIRGAFKYGKLIAELPEVDLAVEGCVAVDLQGKRLGKGGGYGDKEIKMVRQEHNDVRVLTTCHPIQIVEEVPAGGKDERIDIIVTPERIYHVQR
jgi:5-formyltetrahydrofolate cyclo-ligase